MESPLDELGRLKHKCIFMNQFMAEHGGFPPAVLPFFIASNKRIEEAYSMFNLRMLRLMSKDIDNQVIKYLPVAIALKMGRQFKLKMGIDFQGIATFQREVIKKILIEKKIDNGEEYMLVKDFLNKPENNLMQIEEEEQLEFLLAAFIKSC